MSIARTSQDLTQILASARARRDHLIREHVGMAKRISSKMVRRGGSHVDRDDAMSAALLGLTEAADRFDPTRGEPFVAFAEKRIRGAVLDELRRGDFLPRRVRQTVRRAAQVVAELERAGAPVTDLAVATALGISADEYRDDVAPLAGASMTTLETQAEPTTAWPSPAAAAESRQTMSRIGRAVEQMPQREAEILSLHYGDDLPYRAIASKLGMSSSRVCQLHNQAIERIRAEA